MSIEAMRKWREALACALSDDKPYIDRCKQAIESIDQAIDAASQLPEAEKQDHVVWVHAGSFDAMIEAGAGYSYIYPSKRIGASKPLYTHPQPKREPLTDGQVEKIIKDNMSLQINLAGIRQDFEAAHGITSDMKQEHVDKTAKQRHEENT